MIQNICNKNKKQIPVLIDFLKIISEPNRLRIICYLEKNDEQCVCKITEFLALPQNLVSHHLKVLRDFGLLGSRKSGLNVYYLINEVNLNKYQKILNNVLAKRKGDGDDC
jgi:ArsR family transcriptional regulator